MSQQEKGVPYGKVHGFPGSSHVVNRKLGGPVVGHPGWEERRRWRHLNCQCGMRLPTWPLEVTGPIWDALLFLSLFMNKVALVWFPQPSKQVTHLCTCLP